jgi:hypothetical protein
MLLLLHYVFCNADVVIVLQRQLDGFVQADVARGSAIGWLARESQRAGER